MARFGPDASMAPDSGREFRLVSRWLLALGLRLLRALRRHRCACRPQLRGPLRRLQRRPRLDWATPTRRPLALTPASAACVVRRLSCKNHFTTETQRHRDTEKNRFTNCEGENCDARLPHRALPMLRHQIDFADPVFWVMAHPPKDRQLKDRQVIRRVPGTEQASHEAQNQPQHDDTNR